MAADGITCTLELCDERTVLYEDDRHMSRPIRQPIDDDPLRWETINWFAESLGGKRAEFCNGRGLKLLGRHLYELVFHGEIDRVFRETYAKFDETRKANKPSTLRLEIVFHPDAEPLAKLPWEFLYVPGPTDGTGAFLSGEASTLALTRVVPGQIFDGKPLERAVRVLLVVSTPPGLDAGTTGKIRAELHAERERKTLELDELDNPTYSELQQRLEHEDRDKRPDVVHLIGHGAPGALYMSRDPDHLRRAMSDSYLAQSEGKPVAPVEQHEEVRTSKVEALFSTHRPRLVFMQNCYGAAVGQDVLVSTALDIARSKVPAVVAMQYDIAADTADDFAVQFYRSLIGGSTIGCAVSAGRRALATSEEQTAWERRDFGTPVVYAKDGEIVTPQRSPASDGDKQQRERTEIKCPRCAKPVKFRVCANCKLRLHCQCAKERPECGCSEEFEYPVTADGVAFCAACEHEYAQPQWPPPGAGLKVVEPPPKPGAGTDRFEQEGDDQPSAA